MARQLGPFDFEDPFADADGNADGYVGCDVDADAEANERREASLKL